MVKDESNLRKEFAKDGKFFFYLFKTIKYNVKRMKLVLEIVVAIP